MLKEKLKEIGLTDEQAEKVIAQAKADIDENYIPKTKFDEINTQLKTANEELKARDIQLEELKKADINGLKEEIKRLQEENRANTEANDAAIRQMKIDNAVDKALITAKAKNPKAVKALLELDGAEIDGDDIKGLDKQIKKLMEAEDSSFLFEGSEQNTLTGIMPSPAAPHKSVNSMNYTELAAYLANNPNAEI